MGKKRTSQRTENNDLNFFKDREMKGSQLDDHIDIIMRSRVVL